MKWFLSIFVTSLLARCSSVNTDDFPFPDTDDFPIQTECDIDRPCADPNECCSLLGQCGADNFYCGLGCIAGPCKIICGDPDNLCNPNECCSVTGNCGVGDEYCGAACVGGACNDPLEPVQPSDAPVPCTTNDQCNDKTECCTWFGFCNASEGNPYCTYNNAIDENEYPIDMQECNYYSWTDTCPERQCCTMFGRCSFAPSRFCHGAAGEEATSYLRKSRV